MDHHSMPGEYLVPIVCREDHEYLGEPVADRRPPPLAEPNERNLGFGYAVSLDHEAADDDDEHKEEKLGIIELGVQAGWLQEIPPEYG